MDDPSWMTAGEVAAATATASTTTALVVVLGKEENQLWMSEYKEGEIRVSCE